MEEKKLVKTGFIYLGTSILTNIQYLFLISLYTRSLTTAEFGQYNIILAIQSFLSIFISLNIFSGMCRFINEYEDKNMTKNIALTFSIVWGAFMIVLTIFFAPFIANILFKGDANGSIYVKYVIFNCVLLCIITIYESYYTMQYHAIKASAMIIGKILLTLIFTLYFVVFCNQKILGVLYAMTFSYLLLTIILLLTDAKNIKFVFRRRELKEQLSYGLGLMPGDISDWILTLVDRYFIKELVSLSAVGVYSLGYKMGMLIQPAFIQPFARVFTAYKFDVYKTENGKDKIRNLFYYYNAIGWFCIFGISIFAKLGVHILGSMEYIEAYKIAPMIALAYYISGLGAFYALGLHIVNKMIVISVAITISAIVNIILNILLIPAMGMYGAAISTFISYIVNNAIYYFQGKKYYDIKINFLEPYKFGIIYIILYGFYFAVTQFITSVWIEIPINIVLCFIYLFLNIQVGFISRSDFEKAIKNMAQKFNNTKRAIVH